MQVACILECRIERALMNMTENERCIPWFYPPLETDTRLCSPFEAEEFKTAIELMSANDCKVNMIIVNNDPVMQQLQK